MIIRENCSTCYGQGWIETFEQVDEYEWEPYQDVCRSCNGSGYTEIEVDEKTGDTVN
jgi:DnaJ-class molecular chaperone